jgi:hypothetical protein
MSRTQETRNPFSTRIAYDALHVDEGEEESEEEQVLEQETTPETADADSCVLPVSLYLSFSVYYSTDSAVTVLSCLLKALHRRR